MAVASVTHFFPFSRETALLLTFLLLSLMEYVNRFAPPRFAATFPAAEQRRPTAILKLKPWKQSLSFRNICRVDATKDM